MADRKYYVICELGCKFESMTKEQILTAITQAVNEGTIGDIDTGFVTTIKTINGKALKFFVGQQSEYEALTDAEKDGLFAIITNDTSKEALENAIAELKSEYEALIKGLNDGSISVEANAIVSNEKYYLSIGTSGAKLSSLECGKTYIISAKVGEHASNERDTFIIHLPNDSGQFSTGISGSHCCSTLSSQNFYIVCIKGVSGWTLYFKDSSGADTTAEYVTIREI